ncbi:MAG: hypothetical protein FWB72_00110 [Firmicutes bacterium]|nr:hypothetical protein [Bacillota bacterium]
MDKVQTRLILPSGRQVSECEAQYLTGGGSAELFNAIFSLAPTGVNVKRVGGANGWQSVTISTYGGSLADALRGNSLQHLLPYHAPADTYSLTIKPIQVLRATGGGGITTCNAGGGSRVVMDSRSATNVMRAALPGTSIAYP